MTRVFSRGLSWKLPLFSYGGRRPEWQINLLAKEQKGEPREVKSESKSDQEMFQRKQTNCEWKRQPSWLTGLVRGLCVLRSIFGVQGTATRTCWDLVSRAGFMRSSGKLLATTVSQTRGSGWAALKQTLCCKNKAVGHGEHLGERNDPCSAEKTPSLYII